MQLHDRHRLVHNSYARCHHPSREARRRHTHRRAPGRRARHRAARDGDRDARAARELHQLRHVHVRHAAKQRTTKNRHRRHLRALVSQAGARPRDAKPLDAAQRRVLDQHRYHQRLPHAQRHRGAGGIDMWWSWGHQHRCVAAAESRGIVHRRHGAPPFVRELHQANVARYAARVLTQPSKRRRQRRPVQHAEHRDRASHVRSVEHRRVRELRRRRVAEHRDDANRHHVQLACRARSDAHVADLRRHFGQVARTHLVEHRIHSQAQRILVSSLQRRRARLERQLHQVQARLCRRRGGRHAISEPTRERHKLARNALVLRLEAVDRLLVDARVVDGLQLEHRGVVPDRRLPKLHHEVRRPCVRFDDDLDAVARIHRRARHRRRHARRRQRRVRRLALQGNGPARGHCSLDAVVFDQHRREHLGAVCTEPLPRQQ